MREQCCSKLIIPVPVGKELHPIPYNCLNEADVHLLFFYYLLKINQIPQEALERKLIAYIQVFIVLCFDHEIFDMRFFFACSV